MFFSLPEMEGVPRLGGGVAVANEGGPLSSSGTQYSAVRGGAVPHCIALALLTARSGGS